MSKNITKSSIDWVKLEKLVPPEQKGSYMAFKAKSENYLRRVLANPPTAPAINWEEYKKIVPVPGLVDKLMSEYQNLKIPYPEDKYTAEVDKQWASLETEIKSFCATMQQDIQKSQGELNRINSLPRFDEITMEMYAEMYPKEAIHFVEKPSFWPHSADEQLGYKDPTAKAEH
ncbi:ATP synthase subunit d, mitochondrial-like [Anticarsia gemmatalis]|uniref:ATP synthase subunit d, mitochondrial-like n=1 Tax=Anticarsia gemmatalis TaxID=129554 RepID=UPI003F75A52C